MKLIVAALLLATPAMAQVSGDVFKDGANGAKVHAASGFACPLQVGYFQRDAVGERDPKTETAYCAYSALDGVYGTITLQALNGPYDPKTALVPDFLEQEATGGKKISESTQRLGNPKSPVSAFSRTYETSHLGELRYRTTFAASAVGQWAVEVTMEYASPRDNLIEKEFLDAVYAQAGRKLANRD
jgi:hypothetical protein